MNKWLAEFELEDGDTMPEHMDLEYKGARIDFHCKQLEQVPKTGHWIKYGIPRCGEQHYQCTACKYYVNFGQWGELYTKEFKYCPNCGAKMVEQESER